MAEYDPGENSEGALPERGRVNKVSQKWRVYEDGVLAHQMQNEEFEYKYGLNRFNRKTSRNDVPVAKLVNSEEEERLQRERLEYLERQKAIAERDAFIAKKVQDEMLTDVNISEAEKHLRAERDAEIARKIQEEMLSDVNGRLEEERKRAAEDAAVASQIQREEEILSQRLQQELSDEEYAKYLQEREAKRYERKQKERELIARRKALEREQETIAAKVLAGYKMETGGDDPGAAAGGRRNGRRTSGSTQGDGFPLHLQAARLSMSEKDKGQSRNSKDFIGVLRPDGRVEDLGDFSDFYIQPSADMDRNECKELQELQDEELARLLQDQEHKRGAHIDKQKLGEIESKDAEIARLLYQQEKLKAKKHAAKHAARRSQSSQDGKQNQASPSSMDRTERPGSMPQATHHHDNERNAVMERLQPAGNTTPTQGQGARPSQQGPMQGYPGSAGSRQGLPGSVSSRQGQPRVMIPSPEQTAAAGGWPSRGGSGADRGENPYATRPLPSPPHPTTPQSPPPGYNTTQHLQQQLRQQQNGGKVSSSDRGGANMFSVIDPTCGGLSPPADPRGPPQFTSSTAGGSGGRLPPKQQPEPQQPPPTQQAEYANTGANRTPEDGYCDLDDIRPPVASNDFAPVQGQRRDKKSMKGGGSKKGDKDKNCKQQ